MKKKSRVRRIQNRSLKETNRSYLNYRDIVLDGARQCLRGSKRLLSLAVFWNKKADWT